MALCESQLDSSLMLKRDESEEDERRSETGEESPEKKAKVEANGVYGMEQVPAGLPLAVDYRSPVSHFIPPAVELYAASSRNRPEQVSTAESSNSSILTPMKRKRGRPRVDKTSPEYLANLAARKQAREMASMSSSRAEQGAGEKRKRGRPRVDKTSAEYLARKRARELEAYERKAKREYRRRTTGAKQQMPTKVVMTARHAKKMAAAKNNRRTLKSRVAMRKMPAKIVMRNNKKVIVRRKTKFIKRKDSAASSSAGESTPRIKRPYKKRTPNSDSPTTDHVKRKRGRPRKSEAGHSSQQAKIRVRSNLMPMNSEPITLDSDDEPNLGSPSQASDSLSLDENLRALRHLHEKYANIDKDDQYEAHLLALNVKKPGLSQAGRLNRDADEVLSVKSSEGGASVKDGGVEKLEDSTDSSSSSGSDSSSSGSDSSSSSSSDSSDSESDVEEPRAASRDQQDDRSFGAWSAPAAPASDSDSDPERAPPPAPPRAPADDISESDNESADKSFQCHICRKWYSTRVTLKIHRRSHQSRGAGGSRSSARYADKYECDCCNMAFNRREKLWEHKAEAHRGTMTVRCEVCKKCFEDDNELAAHDSTHTDDDRAGRCSTCGATFPRYEQLRRHRATAHAPPAHPRSPPGHACAQCGRRFTHAHSLARHAHNHARQLYKCVVCKASFARADQLAQHLNSHLASYKRLKP